MSNLLPAHQKISIRHLYRKRFMAIVFMLLIGFSAIGVLLLLPSLMFLRESRSLLIQKRDTLAGRETSTISRTLGATIGDINTRLGVFSDTAVASPLIAPFIDPVLRAKTNAIHLTTFSYIVPEKAKTATIEISGTADNRETLLAFAEELRKIPGFSAVTVPIGSFIKDTDVTFNVTATLAIK